MPGPPIVMVSTRRLSFDCRMCRIDFVGLSVLSCLMSPLEKPRNFTITYICTTLYFFYSCLCFQYTCGKSEQALFSPSGSSSGTDSDLRCDHSTKCRPFFIDESRENSFRRNAVQCCLDEMGPQLA